MTPEEERRELQELAIREAEDETALEAALTRARELGAQEGRAGVREDLMAEVDAKLAEVQLARREERAEAGELPIDLGAGGPSAPEMTWKQIEEGYGDGTVSNARYEAAKEIHDRERRRG